MNTVLDREKIHEARSIRTVAKLKGEWLENVRANVPYIKNDLSALWLDRDYPEIISVAAGPSLEKDIAEIKKLQEGREIICVDAALRYLLDSGITPDYMICTDSSEKILKMIHDVGNISTKLIVNVVVNPKLIPAWTGGDVYWFVTLNQFYDLDEKAWIQDLHSVTARIGTKLVPGGNVSSVALGFCLGIRNANHVYLAGHDFCWTDKMYCGTDMDEFATERIESETRSGTIVKMKDNNGRDVITTLSLAEFAKWHDEAIKPIRHRITNLTDSTILRQVKLLKEAHQ